MGVWGTGLYSDDFALDLRKAVSAAARLPFDGDRLVELLCSLEPESANNPADEDHATFWLVVADQFTRRGIESARVRQSAFAILDGGLDLAMRARRGMNEAGLKKRRRMLDALRSSFTGPSPAKPRSTLKKPQALLMQPGEVWIYPVTKGHPINPYFKSKETMVPDWQQDGWGAAVIAESGRAFDFLAWYRLLTLADAVHSKPDLAHLHAAFRWALRRPGTCSALHLRKMELEKIGTIPLDRETFERAFPSRPGGGASAAIEDISIANQMTVGPQLRPESIHLPGEPPNNRWGRQYPGIRSLAEIVKSS